MQKVLVFSVGLNCYEKVYDRCMASHQRYAEQEAYDYVLVKKPRWATVIESVWLKIPLILAGLKAGYDWVFFVDAEATDWIIDKAQSSDKSLLAFVNPDCLNIAYTHTEYIHILQNATRVLPDGIGIHIGCSMLGFSLKANVNGTEEA